MAKNITSELFSLHIFRYIWYKSKVLHAVEPRPKMYKNKWMPEFFIDSVARIISYRRVFYGPYLTQAVRDHAVTFSKSNIDFYIFFKENIVDFFPNKNMLIFDKIFMSLVFTIEMCYWCSVQGTLAFIYYVPFCWELFFQTDMTEQFHDKGGWDEFILYAEFFKQSKIFSLTHSYLISFNKYGFVNLKEIFETAIIDYNILELIECFKEKLQNRKDQGSKFCLQCLPLYTAMSNVAYPEEKFTYNNILIEGYVQLLLHMLSDKELEALTANVTRKFKLKKPEMFDINSQDHQSLSNLSPEEKRSHEMKQDELELMVKAECKKSSTKILMGHLFKVKFESQNSDSSARSNKENFNTCIFCAKEVCEVPEPVTESMRDGIKFIKSHIGNTIKVTALKNTPNTKIVDTEDELTSAEILEVDNHILIEENSRDEKDALRLFLALGVEPGRTNMLNSLKKKDLKLATEDLSKLKLEESVKINRKKKTNL